MNVVAFDSETHLLSIDVIFWESAGAVRSVQQQFLEPACAGPIRVLRGVFARSGVAAGGARWASPPLRADFATTGAGQLWAGAAVQRRRAPL